MDEAALKVRECLRVRVRVRVRVPSAALPCLTHGGLYVPS